MVGQAKRTGCADDAFPRTQARVAPRSTRPPSTRTTSCARPTATAATRPSPATPPRTATSIAPATKPARQVCCCCCCCLCVCVCVFVCVILVCVCVSKLTSLCLVLAAIEGRVPPEPQLPHPLRAVPGAGAPCRCWCLLVSTTHYDVCTSQTCQQVDFWFSTTGYNNLTCAGDVSACLLLRCTRAGAQLCRLDAAHITPCACAGGVRRGDDPQLHEGQLRDHMHWSQRVPRYGLPR